jgi:diguanylate cyclase
MIEEARKELIHISSDFINDLLKQKKQIEELNHRAIQDSMTGLMNFHFFNETLEKEINRSMQYRLPLSLIMSDVDHFKRINDTWGHLAGDHILQSIAQCLQKSISEPHTLSRYGGEEFAIILPETDLSQATKIAEALRAEVQELQSEFEGVRIPVTMSFGIADLFFKQDNTKNTLIKKADHALYTAKKSGRNRCHAYSASSEHPGL